MRINVFDKELDVRFFSNFGVDRRMATVCVITTFPERHVFSGATIKHPNDSDNPREGRKIALKRAVLIYLYLSQLTGCISKDISFKDYWDEIRIALWKAQQETK